MKKRPIVSALLAAVLLTSSWSPAAFAATIPAAAPQSVVQQVSISNLDQAKDAIHQALSNMSESVQLGQYGLTEQEFSDLYDAILREDPWLFYVEGCTFHVNRSGIVVDMIPRNTYDPATVQTMREELTQSMQAALSCIDPNMTATEKVVQVHNYLALTCAYDYENYQADTIPRSSYTAYGALVSRRAVCQGYSLAFELLMQQLGIPCAIVESDPMNHAWNAVQLDGTWYHVDVTWDDSAPDRPGRYSVDMLLTSDMKAGNNQNQHRNWEHMPSPAYSTILDNMDWGQFISQMETKYRSNTALTVDTSSYTCKKGSTYVFKVNASPNQIVVARPVDSNVARVKLLRAETDGSYYFQLEGLQQGNTEIEIIAESGRSTRFPLTVQGDLYQSDTTGQLTLNPGQTYYFKLTYNGSGPLVLPYVSSGNGIVGVKLAKTSGNYAIYAVTAAATANASGTQTYIYATPNGGTPVPQFSVRVA